MCISLSTGMGCSVAWGREALASGKNLPRLDLAPVPGLSLPLSPLPSRLESPDCPLSNLHRDNRKSLSPLDLAIRESVQAL